MIIYVNPEKKKIEMVRPCRASLKNFLTNISFFCQRELFQNSFTRTRSILRRKFSGNSTKRLAQFSRTSGLINRIKQFPLDLCPPLPETSLLLSRNIREHYGLSERGRERERILKRRFPVRQIFKGLNSRVNQFNPTSRSAEDFLALIPNDDHLPRDSSRP